MDNNNAENPTTPPDQLVRGTYDVIVVGAGHAGCEAALASARMGCKTLLLTMNLDSIALMPCNPSMGGPAKGHLIKEIDALGGEIGRNTDRTFIQIRLLNTSKGPAVRALRAQCDKQAYRLAMKYVLEGQPNLTLKQARVVHLLSDVDAGGHPRVTGVVTSNSWKYDGDGWQYRAPAVILTTGTFINGRLVVGDKTQPGGRAGEGPALGISDSLRALGLEVRRFKTGTPPRIDARSIDFSKTIPQPGSRVPLYFSSDTAARADVQLPGTRPNSIYPVTDEDLRGWRPQLPCYLVHTNERTHQVIRDNLHRSPLYTGIIAGINAALYARGEAPFVLGRHEAYLGVLVDDLVTRPLTEPYRLHTSRAEYRLLLRPDSADLRLSDYAYKYGLIDDARYEQVTRKRASIASALQHLDNVVFTSSRITELHAQELEMAPLGQMFTARE